MALVELLTPLAEALFQSQPYPKLASSWLENLIFLQAPLVCDSRLAFAGDWL